MEERISFQWCPFLPGKWKQVCNHFYVTSDFLFTGKSTFLINSLFVDLVEMEISLLSAMFSLLWIFSLCKIFLKPSSWISYEDGSYSKFLFINIHDLKAIALIAFIYISIWTHQVNCKLCGHLFNNFKVPFPSQRVWFLTSSDVYVKINVWM